MAGYSGYSKSNNALLAEADGKLPLSALTKRISRYFPGVKTSDVRRVLTPREWHHTSCKYNRTDYYDLRDLAQSETRRELRQLIAARRGYEAAWRTATRAGATMILMPESGRDWYMIQHPRNVTAWSADRYRDEARRLERVR